MRQEILTAEQMKLLPLLENFSKDFFLVGGTAIALQIGHRQSIDFDMFSGKEFDNLKIRRKIGKFYRIEKVFKDETGQFTFLINGVQFTFFNYPFKIPCPKRFKGFVKMPDLKTLAAMKAYALGKRAKWKDYVDLYFVFQKYHSIKEIVENANKIFGAEFNERIFRQQLSYFDDINYSEKVIYMPGQEVSDEEVKNKLIEFSLS